MTDREAPEKKVQKNIYTTGVFDDSTLLFSGEPAASVH
jgi:hypothetical protein